MLRLLDTLYSFDFDGDLSPYLMPEEREDYQMALDLEKRALTQLELGLPGQERGHLEVFLRNQEEAGEGRERLSFRRGLLLGIKLGALAGR